MSRIRWVGLIALLAICVPLSACSQTNYKAVGYVDGEAGVQALAGKPGEEKPITQPYVIRGKGTVIGQYPEQPHLEVILEPGATVEVQNPTPVPAAGYCPPAAYGTRPVPAAALPGPVVLDGGNTVIRRR